MIDERISLKRAGGSSVWISEKSQSESSMRSEI